MARTQSSLAVSADGANWLLLNASPDLRQQIAATPALWPRETDGARASPIKAVALTNGDVDHIAGLLNLRERQAFDIYASARVLSALKVNSLFTILAPDLVPRRELTLNARTRIFGGGVDLGLDIEAFAAPGKIALYLEDKSAANFGTEEGDTLGLLVTERATGKRFTYLPACARMTPTLRDKLSGIDMLFFDGTLWSEDEMLRQNLMPKTGSRMGHMNMSGPDGSIAALAPLNIARKIFIHINNSNPALDKGSAERAFAEDAGWTIAEDGMRFEP